MLSKFKAPEFHPQHQKPLPPQPIPPNDSVVCTFGETKRPLENEKLPESFGKMFQRPLK